MENDMTFVAPEGVYSVTEEHKPSGHTINAHPTAFPTRLSTVLVRFPATKAAPQGFAQLLGGGGNKEAKREKEQQRPKQEDNASLSSSDTDGSPDPVAQAAPGNMAQSPAIDDQPTLFSRPNSASGKKKTAARPKHNMRTTSSTFITRLHTAEGLTKALQGKQGDVQFVFYNSAKSFFWTEAGAKQKELYARITFSAYPTCHDVNLSTVSSDRLDVIIGFSTGDLVWFDPMTARYTRLNKGGCITSSPCTAVRWVPSSPNLFLVTHADGTIIVWDKERDDGAFTPSDPDVPPSSMPDSSLLPEDVVRDAGGEWNPLYSIFVSMPPWHPANVAMAALAGVGGKPEKEKTVKNPVSHWRVSRRAIVDFVFSPDVKYVAAISEDGCLRVIDALAEQLVDCYASYFGALTAVAWSPDGRFILTGGQDDLVTIISPWEQRVIARGQGHSSFISALAFDESRCDGRTYRFGSVGEDNKLILWDFSSGALHRPKLHSTHHSHQRLSMASSLSLAGRRAGASALHLPPLGVPDGGLPRFHPAPSRNEVAVVQPVLIKQLEADLLSDLMFVPRGVLTTAKTGHTKLWIRPLALRTRNLNKGRGQSLSDAQDVA